MIDTTASIEVFDVVGKRIISQKLEIGISIIDISDFNDGLYLLKLTNTNNQIKTVKIVKQ